MSAEHPEMSAADVIEMLQRFRDHGIDVCVDGGWGVDALVGRQTRRHADLDIAVDHRAAPVLRALLAERGYREVPRDDSWECNFVLGDAQGHLLDVHTYLFDAAGGLVFGVPYPFDSLRGSGSIQGFPVQCITPEWMVKFHTGYPLDENDYRDVKVLCQQFGIAIPEEYAGFVRREAAG